MTDQTERTDLQRPGWPEVAVGLAGLALFGFGIALVAVRLPLGPVATGLILAALSGVGGLAGFWAAWALRIRDLRAFGVVPTTARWLWIGAAAGVAAFVAKALAVLAYAALTGDARNVQMAYGEAGSGGPLSLVAAILFIAVLTPIGEELLFRGVLTRALLRFGAVVGVVGGALVFALFHGLNPVFPAALVTGLVAGEVFRRSGSVWPAVVVHGVVNLPTVPVLVWVAGAGAGPGA